MQINKQLVTCVNTIKKVQTEYSMVVKEEEAQVKKIEDAKKNEWEVYWFYHKFNFIC